MRKIPWNDIQSLFEAFYEELAGSGEASIHIDPKRELVRLEFFHHPENWHMTRAISFSQIDLSRTPGPVAMPDHVGKWEGEKVVAALNDLLTKGGAE